MTNDIVLNQATINLIGTILAPFILAISTLFWISVGRTNRAEKQVDELIPLNEEMLGVIVGLKDAIKTLQEDIRNRHDVQIAQIRELKDELLREQGRRA